jgi:hypothetical protein
VQLSPSDFSLDITDLYIVIDTCIFNEKYEHNACLLVCIGEIRFQHLKIKYLGCQKKSDCLYSHFPIMFEYVILCRRATNKIVRFLVFMAVTMKNAVLWDVCRVTL